MMTNDFSRGSYRLAAGILLLVMSLLSVPLSASAEPLPSIPGGSREFAPPPASSLPETNSDSHQSPTVSLWPESRPDLNIGESFEPGSMFDVVAESLAGPLRKDLWRSLEIETFFTDGWDEQYAPAPHDTPHQTWINDADGGFYRLYVLSFAYATGVPGAGSGNAYNGEFFLFSPFSRRFELGWFVPFVNSTPSASGAQINAGDVTIAPRFLLDDRRNFTATANVFVRTPTGQAANGNGVTSFSPDVEFWWTDPVEHWVVRGALGVTLPLEYSGTKAALLAANPWTGFNASPSAFQSFDARLAIGKHLTGGDDPAISHLVVYLTSNLHTQIDGGDSTYFSLTPGFRFHLGRDWYLLGGIEVPLVGPLPFTVQSIFQLIKNF